MASVVGIDLGTTNTVVGVVRDGQASALADEHGERLLPSVVSFHPTGNVLVGRAAKERRLVDATNTIYSIKRLIGRSWDSEEVRRARTRFPFEMREGPGQATLVVARGETYTLPEISAFVLRRAKAIAEASLGESIERAVVTVPANFNDLQRAATKVAGRVAGLEVLRILNEPTAAALAYGYGKGTNERIAVYDFGGGTFDVTLLDLSENVFEVLATAGNTFLGGDDVDLLIAERMADEFLRKHRYDPRENPQSFERLRASAEVLKMRLSSEEDVTVTVAEVAHGAHGHALDLEFRMTRAEFDSITGPLVDQTFDVCREALGVARLQPGDFDQVLLVGGSTRIPAVRDRVEDFFKRPVLGHISPDEVVAIGAAIQAAALTGAERRRGDVPQAPNPSRRPRSVPPARRGGTWPPHVARPSGSEDPNTQPYGGPARARIPTSPGLNDEQTGHHAPPPRRPLVVPSPAGAASRAPNTLDHGVSRGTLPGSTTGPSTIAGLGSLPRDTGRGLGPAAEHAQARARLGSRPDGTLMSAADAAREAQARLEQTTGRQRLPSVADAGVELPLVDSSPAEITQETTANFARNTLGAVTPDAVPVYELDENELLQTGGSNMFALSDDAAPIKSLTAPLSTEEVTWVSKQRKTGPIIDEMALPIPEEPLTGQPAATHSGPTGTTAMPQVAPPWQAPPLPQAPAPVMPPAPVFAPPFIQDKPVPPAPLLVDVTPLSLAVETVSGFCDAIIARNTPVPCEETRAFATAMDNQTSVRVRVAQGESKRFQDNTLLGEVELSGLAPAPRGRVSISVTFALDTDGILNVRAQDVATGRAATATVRLVAVPGHGDIAALAARQATHNVVG